MAISEEQKAEAQSDLNEFFAQLEAFPEKSYTLRLEGGKGQYRGAGLEINKPAGKGLSFTR
jgi:hypothetical protein